MKYRYCILAMLAICSLCLTGCQGEKAKFHITGHITEAQDTMLYLEHLTLTQGPIAIDSVKLDREGAFDLSGDTLGNPEFYRLRIGTQYINLAVDSTETISVEASLQDMAFGYKVEGSGSCDTIRRLTLKLADLEKRIYRVADDRNLTLAERDSVIQVMIRAYKDDVKIRYIQNHYHSSSSYYAICQSLNGALIFNPVQDKSDILWVNAVANAWNEHWPGTERTQNLCNVALQGRRNTAQPRVIELDLNSEKVSEVGIIDMTFPDVNGRERTLSDLRGQVVLLDFTAYGMEGSIERTMQLRELYNKYHERGLEIYQVSMDANEHYWKTKCDQLPWVCVYNAEGADSDIIKLYQVEAIPTYFLIDRNCDLYARQEYIPDVASAIEKLLQQ